MYILGCSLSTWRIIWLPGQKKVTGVRNQVFLTGRTTLTLKPKSFHTARRPDLGRRYVGLNKLQMVPRPHWSQNRQAYANSSASAHALSRNRKVNSCMLHYVSLRNPILSQQIWLLSQAYAGLSTISVRVPVLALVCLQQFEIPTKLLHLIMLETYLNECLTEVSTFW